MTAALYSTFRPVAGPDNSFTVSRTHLAYGLALPLAALLGFFLAEPLGSNMVIILIVLGALLFPVFMRWYHPMLIFSWNASFILSLLPGQPPWWILLTGIGFLVVILNVCIGSAYSRLSLDSVAVSLLLLGVVVVGTAMLTGGAGIRSFGGETFGGKRYVYVAAAILGYFVLTSRYIMPNRAGWYAAMFFLAGCTSILSDLSGMYLPQLGFIVPVGADPTLAGQYGGVVRYGGLVGLSTAVCLFLISRYGVGGLLDLSHPWRGLILVGAFGLGMLGGFRSYVLMLVMIFAFTFVLEGLYRTKLIVGVIVVTVLGAAGLVAFSKSLPLSVQRSLSFLPIALEHVARDDAQGSSEWRLDMWRTLAPEIKENLLLGKGFTIRPDDIYMSFMNASRGFGYSGEGSAVSGDYHNGPLSLLIPFGIWGLLAFGYFLFVSVRQLRRFCLYGDPRLRLLNQLLLAYFMARIGMFFFIFGGFYGDLAKFVGLVGLAVAINGSPREVTRRSDSSEATTEAYD